MSKQTGHLLIVDDNRLNRLKLGRGLEQQGLTYEEAEDGRQALAMMREKPFDMVMLDILMPEMDGYQVLSQMKADEDLRELPVVVISALDEMDSVVRCIQMGAEDYLPKPFDPVLLEARIGACLEKKALRDRQRELFEELRQNYERLRELEKLRDDLTHMIVHDLRTPLTSILTGLMTMNSLGDVPEEMQEFLDMGIQGSQTMVGMINDLLDIGKMEEGSLRLECAEISARKTIERALQQVAYLARDKELELKSEVEPELPLIRADEDKLLRTLVNLLGNAVKFTPTGGTVSVMAKRESDSKGIVFSVSDTGEGIPEEAFKRIFDKFGQVETRKAGRKLSTGLGLTFCKLVAEAHGGKIWVESDLDVGSTFHFEIPCELNAA